jgi:hypothetical protein
LRQAVLVARELGPVVDRLRKVLGGSGTVEFAGEPGEPGLVEVLISGRGARSPVSIAGVRFAFAPGVRATSDRVPVRKCASC